MKKRFCGLTLVLMLLFTLSGCGVIGDKSASMSVIYAVTAVLSLLLLVGCYYIVRSKEVWFLLLFSAVFVVNTGYFSLSVSKTLEVALWANRISYLGSVFLPLSILMVILNISKISYRKWLPPVLIAISAVVFLIAASPGYLDIYYKEVTLETVDGVAVLKKVYGPLHSLYLFYLLSYFIAMIAVIIYVPVKKKLACTNHAIILAGATCVNIGVWLLEQLVYIDFELLSVSYIISELFLLGVKLMVQEQQKQVSVIPAAPEPQPDAPVAYTQDGTAITLDQCQYFASQLTRLTAAERTVYDLYVEGKGTKEVLSLLNITENTLKYHNRNIYSKLGVSSRKQLKELAWALERTAFAET